MNFINSYKAGNKQKDKVEIALRIGKMTLFEVSFDISDKEFRVMILNIGISNK